MFGSERGLLAVQVALGMIFLMGMAAVSVDVGLLLSHKRAVQTAADLAALAGVQELPEDPDAAVSEATAILAANGVDAGEVVSIAAEAENTELVVRVQRSVPLYFARVLGHQISQVPAVARARVLAEKPYPELVPWAVPDANYTVGQEYQLKIGANGGRPSPGNFQIVYLAKPMASPQYQQWVANGYDGDPISIGDIVDPKTGNVGTHTIDGVAVREARAAGYNCTVENLDPQCPLLVIVLVVDGFGNGASESLTVVRFGQFLVTGATPSNAGQATIYGIFVGYLDERAFDPAALKKRFHLVS